MVFFRTTKEKEKIQIKKSDAGYGMQNFKFKIDEEKA